MKGSETQRPRLSRQHETKQKKTKQNNNMATTISTAMPQNPLRTEKTSIGGGTEATEDSQPPNRVDPPGEPIWDMAVVTTQALGGEARPTKPRMMHFPSSASLNSSVWSSGDSASGDSYAWSTSLHSSSDSDSDYSDSDYSDSDYSSSFSGSDKSFSNDEVEESRDKLPKSGGLPIPPVAVEGLPLDFGGLPMTLASLKRDLEKVGRAIIDSNQGVIAAERAHTLASINWLASHVPNAVLDELGHEIRKMIQEEKGGGSKSDESQDTDVASVVASDAMSDVSDLSTHDLNEMDFENERSFDGSDVAEVGTTSTSYGDLANFSHATNAASFLPARFKQQSSALNDPDDRPGVHLIHLIPEDKPQCHNIIDMVPQGDLSDGRMAAEGTAKGSAPKMSSMSPVKVKAKKGVKGLFKRFVKRKKSGSQAPELAACRVDSRGSNHETALSTYESDVSQCLPPSSILGSGDSTASDEMNAQDDGKKEKFRGTSLPHTTSYRCALLFADISGFTKLSTLLDPESLSKAINSYFQLIVNEVLDGKGDILKFAGDAVLIEWKATEVISLENCVEAAVNCAAKIISRCSDFSVLANGVDGGSSCLITSRAAKVETLNVHCGIGAGQMIGIHVGDHELRREYILLGQPIQQATVATDFASLGEVAISPEAHAILSRVCEFDEDITKTDGKTPTVVGSKDALKFASKRRMGVHQPKVVNDVSRGVTHHVEGLEVEALKKYRRMMSLYVHPVVVDNDIAPDGVKKARIKRIDRSAQERHRQEAEIRNVYVMFVNPVVETQVTKNEKANRQMYKLLNDIMNLSSREIKRFSGHLRQFIVDDKGLVMIITFGLRGTTIPNMVAQRALPATIAIHNALQMELGINSKIGATIGEAYCGVVGGVKRHEYAVLGPSVNLAARLMASKMNPGILVDNRVRMMAHRSYGFNALPAVKAKGYAEPVPIFEPLSPLERAWGRIQPNFVGRKDEIMRIMGLARDMILSGSQSKLVLVESKSGMGKTTMVVHCIEHIRKLMGANKHRLIVAKKVSTESDSLAPFGIFRAILLDVLSSFRNNSHDDKSYKSGASIYSSTQYSIAWESLSGRSISQSTCNLTTTRSSDVIQNVCRELDMPPFFVDHALHELLGVERPKNSQADTHSKRPSTKAMVSFMARAFKRCTQDAKLVVVALDDLHYADDLSWKVIREIFETMHNVLFIGTTYPASALKLKVEEDFLRDLDQKHRDSERFVTMKLGCLDREEITHMIMKTLGLERKEVKDEVLEGVAIQSGGMPHFVNEILEHVKRQMAVDADFEINDMAYDSFGDLVLQRLDSFDLNTRSMLNIGAVIGLSFTLEAIVFVEMRTSDGSEDAVRKITEDSLKVAVEEGILERINVGGDNESDGKILTKYSFYHTVWRTALLNLMLEGRKRDLHRFLAETLEQKDIGVGDYMFNTKLFNHWINSGNFAKAADLAVSLGKHFEERLGLPAQSIRLYSEALDLLRESSDTKTGVGGFSARVLNEVGTEDLMCIIRLQIALGQALAMAQQMTQGVSAYQDALKITQAARSSRELKDRSILFPVFSGLSLALKRGHIVQDAECKYEKAMLSRYVQETKLHGDSVCIIHAITLQAEMFSRFGDFEKAIQCHREIEPIYDVEEHSLDLCDEYGSDLGAQSFSASTLWNLQIEHTNEALATCYLVVDEIMPKMEKRNVHSSFMIVFPIVWVMKELGFALEAREYFEEYVCEAYTEYYGEGRSTFFLPLYDPIVMLLDLAGNVDTDSETMVEYVEWALDIDNLGFGTLINSKTGELGRTADSIAAEICYLLAQQEEDEDVRATLIENGIEIASEDLEFTKEKKMILADHFAANMLRNLQNINDNI